MIEAPPAARSAWLRLRDWTPPISAIRAAAFPVALTLVAVLFALHRMAQMGDFPTGIDAGSWIAYGRSWFGDGHKGDAATYPPLVPTTVYALARLLDDPFLASRLVAGGSLAAIMLAAALVVLRRGHVHPVLCLCVAALAAMADPFNDTIGFGGYPQNVAIALLIVSLASGATALTSGRRAAWLLAAASTAGVALSHHTYFLVALAMLAAAWAAWASTLPPPAVLMRRSLGLGAVALIGAAAFLPTYLRLADLGYAAPLDANGLDLADAYRYSVRGAPWAWDAIIALGAISLAATARAGRREPAWLAAASLLATAGAAFLLTAETRLMPCVILGALMGSAWGLTAAWRHAGGHRRHSCWRRL